jgi:hypothetical protein
MSARVVGAWRELVDHARDLGQPAEAAATAYWEAVDVERHRLSRQVPRRRRLRGPQPPHLPPYLTGEWRVVGMFRGHGRLTR